MGNKIITPRPIYDPKTSLEKGNTHKQRLITGSAHNGLVIDVTKRGLTFNAYYEGKEALYAVLREPVRIAWEELDKVREQINKPKKKTSKVKPDFNDKPSQEYLSELPIVTINGMQFYIDGELKQRRPVNNPKNVFEYGDKI